ncbi:hypothetical protein [uncultured Adlercreutzia sp.]|uniref:hypothetical protein n=1 Tax=uncultured Adlercreutzia sp. TaxID=875803 RepID=UPI0026F37E34|nr:hypothetical protein [uncultured Adlercreutzia sp.]
MTDFAMAATVDVPEEELDKDGNDFNDDISLTEEEPAVELTFEEKLAALNTCVMRHPLNREILYKALAFCGQERLLNEAEDYIASLPQFELATQNQYYMLMSLVRAHGLEFIERDDDGNIVTAAMKEGLTEDEADDLVATWSFKTTEVGDAFVEYNAPKARLVDLLNLVPERTESYIDLLEFVGEEPRTYPQIEGMLRGAPALETVIDGHREIMQPSVFVDKLERAGALIWKDAGWSLTEEGEEFLADMKESVR